MAHSYPCWMQHPNVQRPYVDRQDQRNNRGIRLGPIQVHSDDQRMQYEAQGYEVCVTPSPAQYQPEYGSGPQIVPGKPHEEYPKWVTPSVLVNSEAEENAWRASQPDKCISAASNEVEKSDEAFATRSKDAARMAARRARLKAQTEAA